MMGNAGFIPSTVFFFFGGGGGRRREPSLRSCPSTATGANLQPTANNNKLPHLPEGSMYPNRDLRIPLRVPLRVTREPSRKLGFKGPCTQIVYFGPKVPFVGTT